MIVMDGDKRAADPERIVNALRLDKCPDCYSFPMTPGPRGSMSQNLYCDACGSSWNVAPPRFVTLAQRIER
jgi:hypothetical protein